MLNIVVPMAGAGSRFSKAGYKDPKPLISVNGVPMIQLVINNLTPSIPHKFIFICQRSHVVEYDLKNKLTLWAKDSEIVELDGLTQGAACTVLAAEEFINNKSALMIVNSDQYIDCNINNYLDLMHQQDLDGLIMTMNSNDPKWSFVGLSSEGLVTEVAEKKVISNEATVGIYNFKHGSDFVNAANLMIEFDQRVNGEFYVAPTYNLLIQQGAKVGISNIGSECDGMYGLGTPADLDIFLNLPIAKSAIQKVTK